MEVSEIIGDLESSNVLEEFAHVDYVNYDFKHCRTRLDPIGPIFREDVYAALKNAEGSVADAAALIGRPRETLARWLKANKDMYLIQHDIQETVLDTVEVSVRKQAVAGDAGQQRFLLNTLGKDRGYSTRVEATGKDGAELNFARVAVVRISDEQMMRVAKEIVAKGDKSIDGEAGHG